MLDCWSTSSPSAPSPGVVDPTDTVHMPIQLAQLTQLYPRRLTSHALTTVPRTQKIQITVGRRAAFYARRGTRCHANVLNPFRYCIAIP